MDYKDRLIAALADKACNSVSRQVIRTFQNWTDGMQSGEDSGLANLWDEICVQVQGQESAFWNLYLDYIRVFIEERVEKLDSSTLSTIWLQTEEGEDWAWDDDDEDKDDVPYDLEDIANYILWRILSYAADWRNERIRRYLGGGF